jgi:hypothetical protein
MGVSRSLNQAMESKLIKSPYKTGFIKGVKYFLAGIKAVTASAQTFFGTQSTLTYTLKNDDILSPPNLIISSVNSINSLIFTAATRSKQMILPKEQVNLSRPSSNEALEAMQDSADKEKSLCCIPSQFADLSYINQILYGIIVGLSKGSRLFSALSSYNGAVVLCKTLVALSTEGNKDPLEVISDDINKQVLIQLFAITCFSAQILSFTMFQATTVQHYLLNWWFNPEKRNEQIRSQGMSNVLLAIKFLILISSSTFFGIYSTRKGLHHLDKTLIEPIIGFDTPEMAIDITVWISTACIIAMTTVNSIPSTYKYISDHKNNSHQSLTTAGNLFKISGILDSTATSVATVFSSIMSLSEMFNIDKYNSYLIALTAVLIGVPNVMYNYTYGTLSIVEKLYSQQLDDHAKSIQKPLLTDADPNIAIFEAGSPHSSNIYRAGSPALLAAPRTIHINSDANEVSTDLNVKRSQSVH